MHETGVVVILILPAMLIDYSCVFFSRCERDEGARKLAFVDKVILAGATTSLLDGMTSLSAALVMGN